MNLSFKKSVDIVQLEAYCKDDQNPGFGSWEKMQLCFPGLQNVVVILQKWQARQ